MWRLPKTLSNTLANVPGHACTLGPNFFRPNNQTAISSFVSSVSTASTRSKNFHTIPASTPPAANCPGGELMSLAMLVRASAISFAQDYTEFGDGVCRSTPEWSNTSAERSQNRSPPVRWSLGPRVTDGGLCEVL